MTDYRANIAPYLESIRQGRATKDTIRAYTNMLQEFIEFFEQAGFETPNEDFFTALEDKLSVHLAGSTVEKRVRLARRFFTWKPKGDMQITMTENIAETNEEASPSILDGGQDETLQEGGENTPVIPRTIEPVAEQVDAPTPETATPSSPVEEQEQPPMGKVQEPPQEEEQEQTHSTGHAKPPKITIYPDKELEEDIKDLARLAALPVSKFILNLIQHEVENSKEDLALLRRLRAKRA